MFKTSTTRFEGGSLQNFDHRVTGPSDLIARFVLRAACRRGVEQLDLELKKAHCVSLEELIRTYACVINELTVENDVLREQAATTRATVRPIRSTRPVET